MRVKIGELEKLGYLYDVKDKRVREVGISL